MKKGVSIGILFFFTIIIAGFIQPEKKITKAALGQRLFNEPILSLDSSVSCASCHKPEFAFADTIAFSVGIGGKLTSRNTPSVLNMKNRPYFFWDGRASSLEEQALMPIQNPDEMGLPIEDAVIRLREHPEYRKLFKRVFGTLPNKKNLAAALAAFEETLETVNSRFDDWSNDLGELTEEEERGRVLFVGDKAKCFNCHSMVDFTDDDFKNIGLFDGNTLNDRGRFVISKDSADMGKFKTPGLRNIAVTAPYMHNGMFQTLEQVLAYYNFTSHFVDDPINIDAELTRPLGLSAAERRDIIAFLKTLTDRSYVKKAFNEN
ncbi:MAG: c-type cytochrome [Ferruginibacter sp.]|nr:c-type cytochrome [Ferruginibacter sp.]